MRFNKKEQFKWEILFNGKQYSGYVYMQALEAADKDPDLRKEIDRIEKEYIQKHLDILTERD